MRYILGLLAILTFYSLPGLPAAQAQDDCRTQLWGDAKITPPAVDVPEELRRWSGLYGNGRWNRTLCNSIAVLSVDKNGAARVQYAWGTAPTWGIYRAGFDVYPAKINGDSLTFAIPSIGVNVVYARIGDQLHGTWTSSAGVYRTILMDPSAKLALPVTSGVAMSNFSGSWTGTTGGGRRRIMSVEASVDGTSTVTHGWDDSNQPSGFKSFKYPGRLENGKLVFSGGGDRYEFTLMSDGSLSGRMIRNDAAQTYADVLMRR